MKYLSFFVPGVPVPGGSKRSFIIHRKGCPAGKRLNRGPCICKPFTTTTDAAGQPNREWKSMVAVCGHEALKTHGLELFDCAVLVEMTFFLPRPKSHYGKKGLLASAPHYPIGRPDVLKLTRSTEDALTGIIWKDDSFNVEIVLRKNYVPRGQTVGAFIVVSEMEWNEQLNFSPDTLTTVTRKTLIGQA